MLGGMGSEVEWRSVRKGERSGEEAKEKGTGTTWARSRGLEREARRMMTGSV